MKQMTTSFFLSILVFLVTLGLPLEGISDQRQTEIQSLKRFLSTPLKKNEVVYLSLGSASDIIVRVADKTVLFDPSSLAQDELDVINTNGVDLVIY